MKIALDVMGGDHAPHNNITGVRMALAALPQVAKLYLVGQMDAMERELDKQSVSRDRLVLVNATQIVDMSDSGLDAVRKKKDSSMSVAARLVRDGECDAVVSAGHTGAAVAAGTIIIGRLPGVDFPGIASPMPNEHGTCYILDAGANPDAKPEHLVQYAIMGSMLAKHVLLHSRRLYNSRHDGLLEHHRAGDPARRCVQCVRREIFVVERRPRPRRAHDNCRCLYATGSQRECFGDLSILVAWSSWICGCCG